MKKITGDLIELAKQKQFDVIVHGCNCFCKMGSGIAKQIAEKFPAAYDEDKKTISGDRKKLGTITYAFMKGEGVYVVNAYTQFNYGYDGEQYVDYDAIRSCFKKIKQKFGMKMGRKLRFGIPKIGCGLAGGDWEIVSKIIEEEMSCDDIIGEDVTLVIYGG